MQSTTYMKLNVNAKKFHNVTWSLQLFKIQQNIHFNKSQWIYRSKYFIIKFKKLYMH